MRLLFILFFKLIFSNNIFSQNIISGTITDKSNESLVGINIFLSDDKTVGTVSDVNGEFSLNFKGEFPVNITISGIGYETKKLNVSSQNDLASKIILEESFLLGDEVVVSASLFEQNILTAPVSIENLDI